MTNPRMTRTNASDSAPGVDDGPAGVRPPPVDSRPGGRGKMWIAIAVVVLIAALCFFARPTAIGLDGSPHQVAERNPAAPSGAVTTTAQRQPS